MGFFGNLKKSAKQKYDYEMALRAKANAAAQKEREKQTVKSAVYREKYRGEQQRKSIRSPSMSGAGNAFGGSAMSNYLTGSSDRKKKKGFDDISKFI